MKTIVKIKSLLKDIWKLPWIVRVYVIFFGLMVLPVLGVLVLVDLFGCWIIREN